jgi:ribonucleoside-diphosphate reductase alpha chain
VIVRPEEWDEVADYVWNNKEDFSGISFLPHTGDKDYAFAPREVITSEADEEKWNMLLKHYVRVDYTKMVEEEDNTDLTGELACAGGACEV